MPIFSLPSKNSLEGNISPYEFIQTELLYFDILYIITTFRKMTSKILNVYSGYSSL